LKKVPVSNGPRNFVFTKGALLFIINK
jgi:hypothetical protein